eukprot:COSAG06_NODE_61021_length_269_cov_0.600000_1_plen_56_part_10
MKPAYTALLGLGIAVALAAADYLSVGGTDPSGATKACTAPDDTEGSQQQRRLQMTD